MSDLQELFLTELADMYGAEKQLLKALPKMAKAAASSELGNAFSTHLSETQDQVQRIEQVFELLNKPAKSKHCKAMEGLLAEGKQILEEWKGTPALDAALISAAQKVEHYEIASYGCLCTWAQLLGNAEALDLLKQNINEEEEADKKLTEIARNLSNLEAEKGQEEEQDTRGNARSSNPAKSTTRTKKSRAMHHG
jgi:ferritin-like metal-binding protein YciE